jgi:hypothetical protein
MKIHDVFHIELLEPYRESQIPGRTPGRPEPVEVEGESGYAIREIGKSRWQGRKKRVEYFVLWEGYPDEDGTWEPFENIFDQEMLFQFHRQYPDMIRDERIAL